MKSFIFTLGMCQLLSASFGADYDPTNKLFGEGNHVIEGKYN